MTEKFTVVWKDSEKTAKKKKQGRGTEIQAQIFDVLKSLYGGPVRRGGEKRMECQKGQHPFQELKYRKIDTPKKDGGEGTQREGGKTKEKKRSGAGGKRGGAGKRRAKENRATRVTATKKKKTNPKLVDQRCSMEFRFAKSGGAGKKGEKAGQPSVGEPTCRVD